MWGGYCQFVSWPPPGDVVIRDSLTQGGSIHQDQTLAALSSILFDASGSE